MIVPAQAHALAADFGEVRYPKWTVTVVRTEFAVI
jgi:hypothetical protein